MTPIQWLLGDDTGTSSKTLLAAMEDVEIRYPDIPSDMDDFGRCYRLLQHFPHYRANLGKVAKRFPQWGPLVREWDSLERHYREDLANPKRAQSNCHFYLRALREECYKAVKKRAIEIAPGVSVVIDAPAPQGEDTGEGAVRGE